MKTNFHTHNYRCGHAVGTVQDYVKKAIENGYTELGISDHAPFPDNYFNDRMKMRDLEGYLTEIMKAKKKYKNEITIYQSLEIEYFKEFSDYYLMLKEKLDYLLLGLHVYRKNGVDLDAWGIYTREAVIDYANYMKTAIESGFFDIVAHPDLYLINYSKWDQYTEKAAHIICEAAEKNDIVLEVNINGIRKTLGMNLNPTRYLYPYKEFWEIVAQYNIRSIINSDCHDYTLFNDEATYLAIEFAHSLKLNIIDSIF